jgi:nicotinamide mononucleotide (NMN) deamidase PncC
VVSIVNGRDIHFESLTGPETCDVFFDIAGKSRQIQLANIAYKNAQKKFKLSQNVPESAIILH